MTKLKKMTNVKLSEFTNTKTGGIVSAMYYPKNLDELVCLIKYLNENHLYFIVLANMTNVAISEKKINSVIINMSEFKQTKPEWHDKKFLKVSASYKMKELTKWCYKNKVRGLEWMEGIPGTVGAGIYMNAGFLVGQDVMTFLESVEVLNLDTLEVERYLNQELDFRYRYSKLQDKNVIVLSATFLLRGCVSGVKGYLQLLQSKERIKKYHNRRNKNQPLNLPSAGTVFIPPFPWHVGGMLRDLGLLGYTIGGAQISSKSPGFIVNIGGMTGEDYYLMVEFLKSTIKKEYALNLVTEVVLIGFDS